MIQLKKDCLIFQTNTGQQVPCSAEWVTLELIGDAPRWLTRNLIRHASIAVLYYFKHELNREFVDRWPNCRRPGTRLARRGPGHFH